MKKIKINNGFWPSLEEADYRIMKSFDKVFGLSITFLFEDGIIIEYEGRSSLDLFDHTRGKDLIEITPYVTRLSFYVVQKDPITIVFGDYSITIIDTATRIQKINYI